MECSAAANKLNVAYLDGQIYEFCYFVNFYFYNYYYIHMIFFFLSFCITNFILKLRKSKTKCPLSNWYLTMDMDDAISVQPSFLFYFILMFMCVCVFFFFSSRFGRARGCDGGNSVRYDRRRGRACTESRCTYKMLFVKYCTFRSYW